ncbi:MAG: hypothetical protein JWM80_5222 [Cyanobacteria bacterium RYN_339]|nr:hypothetical protein [Cyanobacteria bacterium RYN_339]
MPVRFLRSSLLVALALVAGCAAPVAAPSAPATTAPAPAVTADDGAEVSRGLGGAGFNLPFDVSNGFNFAKDKQANVGYISTLAIGGVTLTPAIQVSRPDGTQATVVAVLSDFSWDGSKGGALNLLARIDTANRQKVAAYLLAPTSTEATLAFEGWSYDPVAKSWYQAIAPQAAPLGALIQKSGGELDLAVTDAKSNEVASPANFALTMALVPAAKAQALTIATSSKAKLTKAWGIAVAP